MSKSLFVRWERGSSGAFTVVNGQLTAARLLEGEGDIRGASFTARSEEPVVIELELEAAASRYGQKSTRLQWEGERAFALIVAHMPPSTPVRAPDLGVTIAATREALHALPDGGKETVEDLPTGREITWENWAAKTQQPNAAPTILGISRDQRFFSVHPEKDTVQASLDFRHPLDVSHPILNYVLNGASSADHRCIRSLEDGCLPILHSRKHLGVLELEETFFVTLAEQPLIEEHITGTPLRFAHLKSNAATFPPGEREEVAKAFETFVPTGEVVLYHRLRIRNTSSIPRIAVHQFPGVCPHVHGQMLKKSHRLDAHGVVWTDDKPLALHRLNGEVPKSLQPAVLLHPEEEMVMDSILSHRMEGLSGDVQKAGIDWEARFAEVKKFWQSKLPSLPVLPDQRISNFWRAGLLHLEMTTLGGKNDALLAKTGLYPAIGSESVPIIDFYDSAGMHDVAERCLNAFLDLQHPNGRINLFVHYDIETGAFLYQAGRHYAYTRNVDWIRARSHQLKKAADYLLSLRQTSDPQAPNYGLIAGTCADPTEATSSFMLNAYNGAGLLAAATLLEAIGDTNAAFYRKETEAFAAAYRHAFTASFRTGPLAPHTRDRWVPTMAPWVEGIGLQVLGLKGEMCYTHRTYQAFDALLGPLYAVYAGLIEPESQLTTWLLNVNETHFNRLAVIESQPYYGRHPEVHLLRGEREPFLNAFFSGLTSLADRETFTFWEHFHEVSMHKTHEEGWALMQARRMLWLENGATLNLLPGIPESWLDDEQQIAFEGRSYFGPFGFELARKGNELFLKWTPRFHSTPEKMILHLPGLMPQKVELTNDAATMTIEVAGEKPS